MFNNKGSFVWRLIGVIVLIGLVVGGGVMAYQAGVAQGIAQAPEVAQALSNAAEDGAALPLPKYGYGLGYPAYGMRPHFGTFPFAGILGSILFVFLFFGLLRLVFLRPWAWHYGPMRGYWKGYSHPWGTPPWVQEDKEDQAEPDTDKKVDK
jgi:hypothetical protein